MTIKYILLLGLVFAVTSCRAQMVQTTNDIYKLVENKQKFIGKPLKDLLVQIKPPIKRVVAQAGGGVVPSCFFFWFLSDSEYHAHAKQTGKSSARIYVQVAEKYFDDPLANSAKKHRTDWIKEDEKKYGNLTVVDIRVTGAN